MSDMPRVMYKKIYLQCCSNCISNQNEVTWCQDHTGHACEDEDDERGDTSYTRTDLVDELIYTLNLRHQSEDVLLVMAALQGEGK